MSRTYRKKTYHNINSINRMIADHKNDALYGRINFWGIAAERYSEDELNALSLSNAKSWAILITTDRKSGSWCPWSKSLKSTTNTKSRAYYRDELSKCYRDWDYQVIPIKHKRHDDVWNWD